MFTNVITIDKPFFNLLLNFFILIVLVSEESEDVLVYTDVCEVFFIFCVCAHKKQEKLIFFFNLKMREFKLF